MWKLVGKGSRRGASLRSRAALRGTVCAGTSSLIHLLVKPLFARPRPWRSQLMHVGPVTSSFPSGHTATDLGFMFGAAQEFPWLLAPLSFVTLGSHWSLLRARKHYPSDILAGGLPSWSSPPPEKCGRRPPPQRLDVRAVDVPAPSWARRSALMEPRGSAIAMNGC